MHIVQLTPGTGNFHCGNCLRDNAMVHALRRQGHDVLMVPLYLPMVVDEDNAAGDTPIFFGGINVYLQHKSSLFRFTPRWLDAVFDAPGLLRKAADKSGMTTARDLGELTVSMLKGEQGHQRKELDRLIDFLAQQQHPDVVVLSNALLIGLAHEIKRRLNTAVVCTLMGEDAFIDSLIEPYRSQAWELLHEKSRHVDAFVAVSNYYGRQMIDRAKLNPDRVHVVPNGIDVTGYAPADNTPTPPTLGFFARLCHGKGLGVAVDTFIELKRRDTITDLRFKAGGSMTPADEPFVQIQKAKLEAAGLTSQISWHPNPDHAQKQSFLASLSALTVPTLYGESFGIYLIEAWAAGTPVIQPRTGAFPELIESTGAGVLADNTDPSILADAAEVLLLREDDARRMGEAGRAAVLERFTVEAMAAGALRVYEEAAAHAMTRTP